MLYIPWVTIWAFSQLCVADMIFIWYNTILITPAVKIQVSIGL